MDFTLLLAISFGLAMDSFAVAVAKGGADNFRVSAAFKFALAFAFAHSFMAIVGWLGGSSVSAFIGEVDHWIAFALLSAIGAKMIYGYFKKPSGHESENGDVSLKTLTMLSLATSVDALVIGVSFALLNVQIFEAISVIAVTIFLMTLLGVVAGKNFHKLLGHKSEVFGGVVLIAIGLKILIEHLQKTI